MSDGSASVRHSFSSDGQVTSSSYSSGYLSPPKPLRRRRSLTLSGLLASTSLPSPSRPSDVSERSRGFASEAHTLDHSIRSQAAAGRPSNHAASSRDVPRSPRKALDNPRHFTLAFQMQPFDASRGHTKPPGQSLSRFLADTVGRGARESMLVNPGNPSRSPSLAKTGLPKDESWSSGLSHTSSSASSAIFDTPHRSTRGLTTGPIASGVPRVSISEESILMPLGASVNTTRLHAVGDWTRRGDRPESSDLEYLDDRTHSSTSARDSTSTRPRNSAEHGLRLQEQGSILSVDSSQSSKLPANTTSGKKKLSEGGGSGWEWFEQESVHTDKVYPCDKRAVPYVLPYDRELVDLEILQLLAFKDRLNIIPWSKSPQLAIRPKQVLDIGCGISAFWITEAAKEWPQARFTGLDIAPVMLPLNRLDPDISARVNFVESNFLEGWPFEDGHFDFVRISNIGAGVPESAWNDIYDEAARVLKSTGSIQCIEYNAPRYTDAADNVAPKAQKLYNYAGGSEGNQKHRSAIASESSNETPFLDPHTLAIRKSEQAVESLFTDRQLSSYPVSIFPAVFVLSFKQLIADGPHRWKGVTHRPDDGTGNAELDSDMRVLEHASLQGYLPKLQGAAKRAQRSTVKQSSRERADDDKAQAEVANMLRHRVGISKLLENRFGWTCKADEIMEEALEEQQEVLHGEREAVRYAQVLTIRDDETLNLRMIEINRSLRETQAHLTTTKRRLGKDDGPWTDFITSRALSYDILMKAGRRL